MFFGLTRDQWLVLFAAWPGWSHAGIGACLLAAVIAGCSPSPTERCDEDLDRVARCDRHFTDEHICATKPGRCVAACFGAASCKELALDDVGQGPPELSRCLYKCDEATTCRDDGRVIRARFRCDGENDCVDGSDEEDCDYFHCEDGTLIGMDSRCDQWDDCPDGSDEDSCL